MQNKINKKIKMPRLPFITFTNIFFPLPEERFPETMNSTTCCSSINNCGYAPLKQGQVMVKVGAGSLITNAGPPTSSFAIGAGVAIQCGQSQTVNVMASNSTTSASPYGGVMVSAQTPMVGTTPSTIGVRTPCQYGLTQTDQFAATALSVPQVGPVVR